MKSLQHVKKETSTNKTKANTKPKKDACQRKSTILYFQIGLILTLLGTYALLEMNFVDKLPPEIKYKVFAMDVVDEVPIENFEIELPKVVQQIQKPIPLDKEPIIDVDPETLITPEKPDVTTPLTKEKLEGKGSEEAPPSFDDLVNAPIDIPVVPFPILQDVPVFPGCENEKGNEAKKKCMSKKIAKLIKSNFNTDIASDYGLSGQIKFYVGFKIDNFGNVVDIKAHRSHPALQKEAQRVMELLPKMQPGKQRGKAVIVPYNQHIKFEVVD